MMSTLALMAKFSTWEQANSTASILKDFAKHVKDTREDMQLGDWLKKIGKDSGFRWSSWWIPRAPLINGRILLAVFDGIPSNDDEDEVIVWLKQVGAVSIAGNLVFDDGGDVAELDFVSEKSGYAQQLVES